MTITAQTSKNGPYTGNGSTATFDFTFYIHDADDLLVVLLDAAGLQEILTIGADYTVAGAGSQLGGAVTLLVPPAVGEKLIVARQVDLTQEVDLQNRGAVNPETLEMAFDKLTQIAQDQQEQLSRAILIDRFDPSSAADFVADVATLTSSAAAIEVIADNIADVNTVATNIDDVIAAAVALSDPTYDSFQLSGGTGAQGTMTWNADEETVDLVQGDVTLQLGQENQWHCRNNTASTILDGVPVMATGTIGGSGRITIAPMNGTNADNARFFLGIATETILAGQDGKITAFGKVRHINTSAWADGDVLYLSPTTVGALTNVAPTSGMKVAAAFVIHSHATNGVLAVRVDTGDENAYQPKAAVLTNTTASFTTAQETKLAGIEALADVTDAANVGAALGISGAGTGEVLSWTGSAFDWVPPTAGTGTVTSVAVAVPASLTVTGSPITTSGTITIAHASGYLGYTTALNTKLSGIEALADVTDAANVAAAGAVMTSAIGVSVQGYSAVLAGTTASYTTALNTKLGGIEALADVTDAANVAAAGAVMTSAIGVSVQGYSAVLAGTTASYTTALNTKLNGIEALADVTDAANVAAAGAVMTSAIGVSVQGYSAVLAGTTASFTTALKTKLDGMTATYTTALDTKLAGIEALADVTDATNVAAAGAVMTSAIGVSVQGYSAVLAGTTASYTTALNTKLNGIEALADVTDAANVAAAGAVMTSAIGVSVQGYTAVLAGTTASFTTALKTKLDGMTATYTTALDTKLAGIEALADVTDATNVAAAGAVMTSAIGVSVQGYSAVLAGTTASYTTALNTKLNGIEALADVTDATNVAAAGAVMTSAIGVSVQAYSSVLAGTTASFTTAYETSINNLGTAAALDISVGTTAPASPAIGDLWVDTN